MEWVRLALEIGAKIGGIVIDALQRGDEDVLEIRVGDLLGELRSSIVRRAAEQRAREKFAADPPEGGA